MKTRALLIALLALAGCASAPPVIDEAPAAPEAPVVEPPPPSRESDEIAAMRVQGLRLRAMGQEPGWILEWRRDGTATLSYDYGNAEATGVLRLRVQEVPTTDYWLYSFETDGGAMTVGLRRAPCEDVMSGEIFPAQVSVRYAGRRFEGCGHYDTQPG